MKVERNESAGTTRRKVVMAGILLLVAGALVVLVSRVRRGIVAQNAREQIVATIQREARASFLVTGTIDITITITQQTTRTLLPGIIDLGLGTSSATVQVPGRAYYGIDVRSIRAEDIVLHHDTVVMRVPSPLVLSAEPNLAQLRTWTSKGWLRTPASVRDAQDAALRNVTAALMRQANAHLATSVQPSINTAHALERMLRAPLAAAGFKKPHFKFEIGNRLQME